MKSIGAPNLRVKGSFGNYEGWFSPVDGARPSFPGIVFFTNPPCFVEKNRAACGRMGRTPSVGAGGSLVTPKLGRL